MKKRTCLLVVMGLAFMFAAIPGVTEESMYTAFEKACAASSSETATPELVQQKVNEACSLLQAKGLEEGFSMLRDPANGFAFAGTYVWVHDMRTVMLMHPIKKGLEDRNLTGLKDQTGKRFMAQMGLAVMKNGNGWVSYFWPKPGEKKASQKVSFAKKCTVNGKDVVVCAGTYDISIDDLEAKGFSVQ
ncbi:MAG: cache domain-containing protein [Thermodesulfobacteriota bacterium]|nr:cache domain-containing protein [Thermodesulfobacteriota bacterium]